MAEIIHQRIAELLCSKICHDLISPVGAINNGMELLTDTSSGMQDDAMSLIDASSRQAAQRLEYFRLAFGGWGGGDEATTEFGLLRQMIVNHAMDNKLELTWRQKPDDSDRLVKPAGKLVLGLVLIAAECARRAASLEIDLGNPSDRLQLYVKISGDRCALHPDVRNGFDQNLCIDDISVRNVVAFNCLQIALANQLALNFSEESPDSVEFNVTE
jgi:histidine phosphotransferase ChpT